ncbi:MAG TPA: sulfatase [Thermoanaerobaculia bacterium]|nr:sulfatase [Thermoanaerobaculia bacterium]
MILAALTVVAVCFHVFMEWLFFVTQPSFLSPLATGEKLLLPALTVFPLLLTALLVAVVGKFAPRVGRCVPALILAATLLLLIDNFARTLSGWGSTSLEGWAKAIPVVGFLLLAWLCYRRVGKWEKGFGQSRVARRGLHGTALALLLISVVAVLVQTARGEDLRLGNLRFSRETAGPRPNILLLGTDGLNADRTSLYGYERKTTPFLERLGAESLVFENAFTNGASTAASTVSMLTSRLPTETGVIYPPDIARGEAAYLHLPALLRQLGYRTGQITVRWYADAADLNLQGAFDWANSRATAPMRGHRGKLALDPLGQMSAYFLGLMRERLSDRLLPFARHRWEQKDPFRTVHDHSVAHGDNRRLAELFGFISASKQPFFAHVHLMGTHGWKFEPRRRVFSAGKQQRWVWMTDFYDDAVLDFDLSVKRVMRYLRREKILDKTIIILYSDHGERFTTADRLPLLIRFPRGDRVGRIAANVQNLDIAPTILDILGVEAPPWMEGTSLLRGELDPCRRIVSAKYDDKILATDGKVWFIVPLPPYFTLRSLAVISGRHRLSLDLPTGEMEASQIETRGAAGGAGGNCPALDPEETRAFFLDHLRANGYKIPANVPRSRLPASPPPAPG